VELVWLWLSEPEHWRDLFIMIYTVAGTLAFLLIIIFTIVLGLLSLGLLMRVRGVVKNNVAPAMENVKETTSTIRGTVTYISDTAVKPVVKVYGTAAGAKQFVSVLMRFARKEAKEAKESK
jgi:hypothetical protein